MIRSDKFRISDKPFAIDLATITAKQGPQGDRWYLGGGANALWFRRKDGTTRACIGTLGLWRHHMVDQIDITDQQAILTADLDGRYGGDCHGRWDGARYWGAQEPKVMEEHLAVLQPMLANYPAVPDGYDGWWRF
ncbi:hypothetical protein ACWGB8_01770 [Kitasatospora sp. NPDC054939]